MRALIYTVTLNPALDYVLQGEALRFDDINRVRAERFTYGGKGINVSAVLTTIGVPTTALGFLAGFTGRELAVMLAADGIQSDFCMLPQGNTRVNVKLKAQPPLEFNAQGPAVDEAAVQSLLGKLCNVRDGDSVVLAGAVPPSLPTDIYETVLKHLQGKDVRVAVDTGGEVLRRTLPYRPFLIKPNHHELGALFGENLRTEAELLRCARLLQAQGARNVLVSRAEDGALLLTEQGNVYTVGNADGTAVNTVGCGDSMVAGFLAGYLKTQDYAYALRLGTACGNATAFSHGLADREAIDRAFSQLHNQVKDESRGL